MASYVFYRGRRLDSKERIGTYGSDGSGRE